METGLWILQVVMALAFLLAGATKAFRYEQARARMAWTRDLPERLVRTIGALEILGAIGLVVPAVTGVLPELTPFAAAGLAVIQVLAIAFHIARREWPNIAANVPLAALAGFAAYARLVIAPF